MFPRNNFDPSNKPWAREVERRFQFIEHQVSDTASRQKNTGDGVAGTLSRMSEQITVLEALVAQQPVILKAAFISSAAFTITNTSLVTRATASITPPTGAKFALILGGVTLNGGSSATPALTQIVHHQMNLSYPLNVGGTNEVIINRFPSLIMPNNAGTPVIVDSGGPLSAVLSLSSLAPGGSFTFSYQTQAAFGGYVGDGSVTANIYGLFFHRELS